MSKERSREMLFRFRGIEVTAQRVMCDDQYVDTDYGVLFVPRGHWIVDIPGGHKWPMTHVTMKLLAEPVDPSLRRRWSESK